MKNSPYLAVVAVLMLVSVPTSVVANHEMHRAIFADTKTNTFIDEGNAVEDPHFERDSFICDQRHNDSDHQAIKGELCIDGTCVDEPKPNSSRCYAGTVGFIDTGPTDKLPEIPIDCRYNITEPIGYTVNLSSQVDVNNNGNVELCEKDIPADGTLTTTIYDQHRSPVEADDEIYSASPFSQPVTLEAKAQTTVTNADGNKVASYNITEGEVIFYNGPTDVRVEQNHRLIDEQSTTTADQRDYYLEVDMNASSPYYEIRDPNGNDVLLINGDPANLLEGTSTNADGLTYEKIAVPGEASTWRVSANDGNPFAFHLESQDDGDWYFQPTTYDVS